MSTCRRRTSCAANVLGTTVDHVIRNLTGEIASVQATADPDPQDIVFEGSFEEVNRLFLENGWSDGLPIVPPTKEKIAEFLAFTDLRAGSRDRQAAARQPHGHGVERRGQRRDGRLPARIHADPGGAGRGDGRSAVRRRAFRQHAGRGDPDRAERAADQAARLQLRAGRAARRLPAQHLDRPLLAPLPAQRRGLPAASERQGHVRQHLARGAGGERGQPGQDEMADGRGRHGRAGGRQRGHHLALHRRQRHRLGVRRQRGEAVALSRQRAGDAFPAGR